jgi:hypothetical protein
VTDVRLIQSKQKPATFERAFAEAWRVYWSNYITVYLSWQTVVAFCGYELAALFVNRSFRDNGNQFQCGHFLPKSIGDCMALVSLAVSPFEKVITFLKKRIALMSDNGIRMIFQLFDNPFHALSYLCHVVILPKHRSFINGGFPL